MGNDYASVVTIYTSAAAMAKLWDHVIKPNAIDATLLHGFGQWRGTAEQSATATLVFPHRARDWEQTMLDTVNVCKQYLYTIEDEVLCTVHLSHLL